MTPTLTQVLAQEGAVSQFNLIFLAAGLAVFVVSAVTIVHGRRLFSRGHMIASVLHDQPSLEEVEAKAKLEKLSFLVDELKTEKEKLAHQNADLQNQLAGTGDALKNATQIGEILTKNNLSLAKECEKLKTEREGLVLAANQPLVKIKKTKVNKLVMLKKGVAKKTKRVSRRKVK